MNKKLILTENEQDILLTMWEVDRPMTRADILNSVKNRTWKETSFYGLLNSLMEKGAIQVGDIVKSGKVFGRTYMPTLTKEEYDLMQLELSLESINPSKSTFFNHLTNLVKANKLNEDDLNSLNDIIRESENEK